MALNQRVLGSSPSASTTFLHYINNLHGLEFGPRRYVVALGSCLGSTASCRLFFRLWLRRRIVASKWPACLASLEGRKGCTSSKADLRTNVRLSSPIYG